MPYKLRKAPKRDLYWVVTIATGKKHSKEPIALEKAKAQMRILESVGNGNEDLKPITKRFNEFKPKFARAKKNYFMQQVGERNNELDAKYGFNVKQSKDVFNSPYEGTIADTYKVETLESPQYPNVKFVDYVKVKGPRGKEIANEIGHRITFIKNPDSGEYEYYNSTGQNFEDLPFAVRSGVIENVDKLENYDTPEHQIDAPICVRHSLERALQGGPIAEYDASVQEEAEKSGKSTDELIWEKSKGRGRKYSSSVKMSRPVGGAYALSLGAKKKPSLRSRVEGYFNPTYSQRLEALQKTAKQRADVKEPTPRAPIINPRDVATGCSAGILGCLGMGMRGGGFWKDKASEELTDLFNQINADRQSRGAAPINRTYLDEFLEYVNSNLNESYKSGVTHGFAYDATGAKQKQKVLDDAKKLMRDSLSKVPMSKKLEAPKSRGFNLEEDLRADFAAMPRGKAESILKRYGIPAPVEGLSAGGKIQELENAKKAYREAARALHPDKGGDAEQFKEMDAAYTQIWGPKGGRRKRRGGADDDVDAELAELMGALPMPAQERPAAPPPRRPVRFGRVDIFEQAPVRFAPAPAGPRRGTKRSYARMQTGRGGALKGTNIAMSLFPAIRSAKSLKEAISLYRAILTDKEKSDLNAVLSLVTNKHLRNFADIPTLAEMKSLVELISNHGELSASAPTFTPKSGFLTSPIPADFLAQYPPGPSRLGLGKCKTCGLKTR